MYYREVQEQDFITVNDVLSAKKEILGYVSDIDDMVGSIYWYRKSAKDVYEEDILFATPSWDNKWGVIPFDGFDGYHLGELNFTKSKKYVGNLPLQLELYFEAIETCLKRKLRKNKK